MVNIPQLLHVRTWKDLPWFYWVVGLASFLSGLVITWLSAYLSLGRALPKPLNVCLMLVGLFFFILSLGLFYRKKWALETASTTYIFLGLALWLLIFLPSGALESSPTWSGVAIATIFTMPFVVTVVACYGVWLAAKKRRTGERRRVLRTLIVTVVCFLVLPSVVAVGIYISDRVGHSAGFGLSFAYRESHVGMDNNSQTFVYATGTEPDELANKFSSATSVTTPFSLPNILSDVGTYTTVTMTEGNHKYTVLFCSQSSPGCKSLLTKGRPLDGSLSTKKYVVTMNNDTYQFLHQFK
jgi:hypothetical protein